MPNGMMFIFSTSPYNYYSVFLPEELSEIQMKILVKGLVLLFKILLIPDK